VVSVPALSDLVSELHAVIENTIAETAVRINVFIVLVLYGCKV
jgi:hypothetical protein